MTSIAAHLPDPKNEQGPYRVQIPKHEDKSRVPLQLRTFSSPALWSGSRQLFKSHAGTLVVISWDELHTRPTLMGRSIRQLRKVL